MPLFVSLNLVDGSNNPVGLGTADLKRSQVTIANGQLPLCGTGGAYKTFDYSIQLTAGTKYAVTVGSSATSPEVKWRALNPNASPTPPSYFVGYRLTSNGGTSFSGSTTYNAIRLEFVCSA